VDGDGGAVGAGACGAGRADGTFGAAGRSATAAVEAVGADALAPGRGAVVAVGLIGGVSEGLGRGVGDDDGLVVAGAGADCDVGALFINCLIRSTIPGSRLARALTLTSSPHFWIRSSNSGLLRPSSFANSWTRVDNGNSSWIGPRPDTADVALAMELRVIFDDPSVPVASTGAPRRSPNPGRQG
jgi:hypothetical protein